MSYLPALAVAGLIAAVAAWAGALATAFWLVVATAVGYAYLYAVARHRQLQYHGGVRAARKRQPELADVVDEVMERAGIRGLDGVWLVPGATAGALIGHRDWLGRWHLGLTIGLLAAAHLDIAELKVVLAHEAGHLTDTNRLRLRLCARRRHASTKLKRRGSRLIVRPLVGPRQITPITLFEAYEALWTQAPEDVMAAIDARMNTGDSPGDTHPGLAERCGGHRYPLAPCLRGDLTLVGLADLDRRCSAALAREQLKRMTAMSWPDINAAIKQRVPQDESSPGGVTP